MNIFCPISNSCLDPAIPSANFSSEAPDSELFYGRNYGDGDSPPLGSNWTASSCVGRCESTISQAAADACAQRANMACLAVAWPVEETNPTSGAGESTFISVPRDVFDNEVQTFDFTCPDGQIFTYTVPAGTFSGFTQAQANDIALSFATIGAGAFRICIGELTSSTWNMNEFDTATVDVTGPIGSYTITIVSGSLPAGLSFSQTGPASVLFSGTPTESGDFTFTLRAVDEFGNSMEKTFTITVTGTPAPVLTLLQNVVNPELSWSQSSVPTTNAIWRSVDSGPFALLATQAGNLTTYSDVAFTPAVQEYRSYKVIPSEGSESNLADASNEWQPAVAAVSHPNLIACYGDTAFGLAGPALTQLDLPALKYAFGNFGIFLTASTLTTVQVPLLRIVSTSLVISATDILRTSLSFPVLASVGTTLDLAGALFTTASFPTLTSIGTDLGMAGSSITTLTVPLLVTIGGNLDASGMGTTTTMSLPALTTVNGDLNFVGSTAFTTISFPVVVFHNVQLIDFSVCALDAASVNHILARGVASVVTGCTFNTSAGTSAAPSGQGILDKATLIAAPNTVTTN